MHNVVIARLPLKFQNPGINKHYSMHQLQKICDASLFCNVNLLPCHRADSRPDVILMYFWQVNGQTWCLCDTNSCEKGKLKRPVLTVNIILIFTSSSTNEFYWVEYVYNVDKVRFHTQYRWWLNSLRPSYASVNKAIVDSDNGLWPVRTKPLSGTMLACCELYPWGHWNLQTIVKEIKNMKMSSAKLWPFCLTVDVLIARRSAVPWAIMEPPTMLLVPICRDIQLWWDKPPIPSPRNCMPGETWFDDVGRNCASVTWTQMYVTLQTKNVFHSKTVIILFFNQPLC